MLQEREGCCALPPDPTWPGSNTAHTSHPLEWALPCIYLRPSHSQGGTVEGQSKQGPAPHTRQGCRQAAPSTTCSWQ